MTLTVYTARITYAGADRLDVTRAFADAERRAKRVAAGEPFAPTWEIVAPVIDARKKIGALIAAARRAKKIGAPPGRDEIREGVLKAMEEAAWSTYVPQYTAEMRISAGMTAAHPRFGAEERAAWARGVRPRPDAWREVESRPRVVLCCFCTDPERCHRRLLAGFLSKRGAINGGEVDHATRCSCGRGLFVEPAGAVCEIHGATP